MKGWMIAPFLALIFGAVGDVAAQDQSKMKEAEGRVKEQLPADPPQESSGTLKGPTLTKPDPERKPEPKFKEPPPPKVEKKEKDDKKE